MSKLRIHLLIGINTILVYGLILFLLPEGSMQQWIVIGIAMAVMMVAPILVINNALNALERRAFEAETNLAAVRAELSSLKEKFSTVTTLDELTGCYNEKYFLDVLLQHRAMSERGSYQFTVAVLQVDQFSEIVDKHDLGSANETLQLFTRIVKAALREVDVVSRLGSDTFALLLSGASEDDAVMIIHRISQLISQIKIKNDEEMKVTASGGITCFHGTESSEDLIQNASKALEFAVAEGRDRVAGFNYKPPEEPAPAEGDSDREEKISEELERREPAD